MKSILVTGADGFVGGYLCEQLLLKGFRVKAAVCKKFRCGSVPLGVEVVEIEPIGFDTDWTTAIDGVNIVIHLAARVHAVKDAAADPLVEYRRVNTHGTETLAKAAQMYGVRRFIYMSSVKVNGEGRNTPYTENDVPQPEDSYGISKFEAEQILREISIRSGLEFVILRPTLIYGPKVRANFLKLMRIVSSGFPIPFGSINNLRHFVYIGNCVDATIACIDHPKAVGETFLVSDDRRVSTGELVRLLALFMGVKPRLFPFPVSILKTIGDLLGKKDEVIRMLCSLYIDNSKIKKTLGWEPPYSIEEGIRETVKWYMSI